MRVAVDATPEETRAFVAGLSVTVEVNTIAAKDELRELRERNSETNATRKESQ